MWVLQSSEYSDGIQVFSPLPKRTGNGELQLYQFLEKCVNTKWRPQKGKHGITVNSNIYKNVNSCSFLDSEGWDLKKWPVSSSLQTLFPITVKTIIPICHPFAFLNNIIMFIWGNLLSLRKVKEESLKLLKPFSILAYSSKYLKICL